jgi:hypothetical protein
MTGEDMSLVQLSHRYDAIKKSRILLVAIVVAVMLLGEVTTMIAEESVTLHKGKKPTIVLSIGENWEPCYSEILPNGGVVTEIVFFKRKEGLITYTKLQDLKPYKIGVARDSAPYELLKTEFEQNLDIATSADINFMLPFLPFGKAAGLQVRRCQGLALGLRRLRPRRLDAEALRLLQHWG